MRDSMIMRREYYNIIEQVELEYGANVSLYFLEQIYEYAFNGKLDNDMNADLILKFLPIKNQIDIDMKKYDKKLQRKSI
jgi:hypothetical protein